MGISALIEETLRVACIFHPVRPQRKDGHPESSPHQTLKFLWTPVVDSNLQNWETFISVLSKPLDEEHLVTAVQTNRRCKGCRKGKGVRESCRNCGRANYT